MPSPKSRDALQTARATASPRAFWNPRQPTLAIKQHPRQETRVSRHQELANKIWSVADLLRGDYKQSEYGRVILPFTVLRRLDCVMTPDIRAAVRAVNATTKVENKES